MAGPEVQTVHGGLSKEACAEPRRQKNRDVFVYVYKTHSNGRLHYSSVSLCSFKQIQSWVERPCWSYLWWCDSALTSVDIMLSWKMSCQLMEELPLAAGRSVATAAMCVNLFPCHFSVFVSTPLPLHLHPFLFFFSALVPPRLHSFYLHSSVTNYSWRLICWLSKVLLPLAWRRSEQEERVRLPLLFSPVVVTGPSSRPASHTCDVLSPQLGVETSQWKLKFCLIRAH